MPILIKIACSLALLYGLLFLFALVMGNRMIFPAPPASYSAKMPGLFYIETKSKESPRIAARFFEANNPAVSDPFTLLYSHGNGEDIGSIVPRLKALAKYGFNVLAYDYAGYGLTQGNPSEAATYAAADAAYAYLREDKGIAPQNIILYGRSLGGGPTFYLARQHEDIAGIITEGTFTSTYRVITQIKLLPIDVFDNLRHIKDVQLPILILHGTRDYVVPFSHAKDLLKNAPTGTQHSWFEQGGHNDLVENYSKQYYAALDAFCKTLRTQKAQP